MLSALQALVMEIENDVLLFDPEHLRERIDALEQLENYFLHLSTLLPVTGCPEAAINERVRAITAKLEAANHMVFETIRREIRRGRGPRSLSKWVRCLDGRGYAVEPTGREGYDYLDELIIGVLRFEEPKILAVEPTAEMVFYQPTPARHIFDLIERTALAEDDVLIDLGSGLGHVPILSSICTSARSVGIEVEPTYVDCARHAAEALNLNRVTFIQQDAREADLSQGTVFYLYTPFTGKMLRTMLDSLRREAASREFNVCSFGSCTNTVAAETWLESVGPSRPDRISIFRSRPPRPSVP